MELIRESEATYHSKSKSGEFMSSHLLSEFAECPYQYNRIISGQVPDKDSNAFVTGRAAHCLILEGREEYEKRYVSGIFAPVNPKTGKHYGATSGKYLEWADEMALAGKQVITESSAILVEELLGGVQRNKEAVKLLSKGQSEGVVRADLFGVPCQIRIDWLSFAYETAALVDLKTCDNLKYFFHDAKRYNYMRQFAFYQGVFRAAFPETLPFFVIAVEKKEPFRCGVFHIPQDAIDIAMSGIERDLECFKECKATGVWPEGYEDIRKFELV